MKKIIDKKIIFGFIIGVLITSGISIGAISMYSANQVSYKKADNTEIDVKTALDELYIFDNSGDATADDIASGKTALVKGKLVTGTYSPLQLATGVAAASVKYKNKATVTLASGNYEGYYVAKCYGDGCSAYAGWVMYTINGTVVKKQATDSANSISGTVSFTLNAPTEITVQTSTSGNSGMNNACIGIYKISD